MSRLPPPPSLSLNLPLTEKPPPSELTPSRLGFPNEFPYEFDSPAFSPGFTSPGDSTETEDESSDDEEDFLAGLTRRLAPSTQRHPLPHTSSFNTKADEKPRQVEATSPQSTLSELGRFSSSEKLSPNLPLSQAPKTSLKRDNAWDVISAAAGEVARLKLGSYESHQNAAFRNEHYLQQQRLLHQMLLCSRSGNHVHKRVTNDDVTIQNLRYMRNNALTNRSWPPQHAGASLKRSSSGTGVFLPRQYPTTSSDSLRKPVNPRATFQSKVNPSQNLDFDELNYVGLRLSQFDYECILARRTLLARQGNFRAIGCLNQERLLPQDWMF